MARTLGGPWPSQHPTLALEYCHLLVPFICWPYTMAASFPLDTRVRCSQGLILRCPQSQAQSKGSMSSRSRFRNRVR